MKESSILKFLVDLGLTPFESEVYVFLVGERPATGYRIAQAMGKTAASIYKTLDALGQKGMVIVDEGEKRLYRAVPPEEMLNRWERRFLSLKEGAAREFDRLETAAGDDRIYYIRSREQLMERCRSMLSGAKRIVVADLFPQVLQEIRSHIEEAAARGIEVRLKVYEPIEIANAKVVMDARGSRIREDRPYEWLELVVDGKEFVLANLATDGDKIFQAVWSESPYLAWIHHGGIESEIIVNQIVTIIEQGGSIEQIADSVSRYKQLDPMEIPGFVMRLNRLGQVREHGEGEA